MRARTVVVAVLLGLAACADGLSRAEAAPRTQVARSGEGAKITLYDSLCDEDNAIECLVAELGCEGPGDFTASLFGLTIKEAAAVFAKGSGRASLSMGTARFTLQVGKVALSPYTFDWDVTATSLDKGREVWAALWAADSVEIQAGAKRAVLRRADVAESGFRDVVATCGAESR